MGYAMNELLELMVDQNAADFHIQVSQPSTLRMSGHIVPIKRPVRTPPDTEQLMLSITPDDPLQKTQDSVLMREKLLAMSSQLRQI